MKYEPALELSRKLVSYSVGVGAATLAAASSAHGDIVFTDLSANPVTANTIDFALMDPAVLPSSTGADFELTGKIGSGPNTNGMDYPKLKNKSKSTGAGTEEAIGATFYALELSKGTTIGSGGTFNTNFSLMDVDDTTGNWKTGDRGFLGLEILSGTTTLYGWADVQLNSLPSTAVGPVSNAAADGYFTLYGYAYDDSGSPIAAGAVPEPASTTALLIAGAAGAAALRRRRNASRE